MADALREVPGAAVVSTGSFGGQTSLFLRGGESDHVKVLIDGVAVNQPGGAFNFNALTLDDVERIRAASLCADAAREGKPCTDLTPSRA